MTRTLYDSRRMYLPEEIDAALPRPGLPRTHRWMIAGIALATLVLCLAAVLMQPPPAVVPPPALAAPTFATFYRAALAACEASYASIGLPTTPQGQGFKGMYLDTCVTEKLIQAGYAR